MIPQKILSQGAEAVIYKKNNFVLKSRIPKSYRLKILDDKIRKQRTKSEIKLLEKSSKIIDAPSPILSLGRGRLGAGGGALSTTIKMPFIDGKKLSENLNTFPVKQQKQICEQIGNSVAKLHDANIVHGDLTTSNMILVEKNKTDNFNKLITEFKKLNLPKGKYALFGSAPLGVREIRECRDIDVIVNESLWKEYRNKSNWKYQITENGIEHLSKGLIEMWHNWLPWYSKVNKFIKDAEIIDGIPFVKLKYCLEWKSKFGREKDLQDIKLIEEYLSPKKEVIKKPFKVFFIDFGLGFISQKIEDKTVDLHLLKQALEAKHYQNWSILFDAVIKGYSKSTNSKKVLEQLKKVEKRGRYKG